MKFARKCKPAQNLYDSDMSYLQEDAGQIQVRWSSNNRVAATFLRNDLEERVCMELEAGLPATTMQMQLTICNHGN